MTNIELLATIVSADVMTDVGGKYQARAYNKDGQMVDKGLRRSKMASAIEDERSLLQSAKNARRTLADRAIVAAGACPTCGSKLRRNLALTGWHQCEQFGAVAFRKDATKPGCGYQVFV